MGEPRPEYGAGGCRRRGGRRWRDRVCWNTRRETGHGLGFTWGRAKASKTSRRSSTSIIDRVGDDEVDKACSRGWASGCSTRPEEAEQEPGTPAGYLASVFGARGTERHVPDGCAASAQAIGEAVEVIRRGAADVMLDGGHAQHDSPVRPHGFHPC